MSGTGNHAIVFGGTGLLGWSVADQLLSNYPEHGSFSTVTAVMNRPVAESELHLQDALPERPRLQIASGINLASGTADDLARDLKEKVAGIEAITHVFYFVFNEFGEDHLRECEINCGMMQRVADAFNILAPKLQSFVYSGGTRGYGIYVPGGTFQAPLEESMAEHLPEDYAKTVAYPWFRKILTTASAGRGWTWTEVCPDAVVGFTPNGSNFSLALHWAQYLSLYSYNHGIRGSSGTPDGEVEVPFPGNEGGFNSLATSVSSHTLGRIAIFAALNSEKCGGKILNMADNARPSSYRELWPAITSWFGLVGVGPSGDDDALKPSEYIETHRHIFEETGRPKGLTCGVRAGSKQLDSVGWWLCFDRHLSLERLRGLGFLEERDPAEGWLEAFDKFKAAGII